MIDGGFEGELFLVHCAPVLKGKWQIFMQSHVHYARLSEFEYM